MKIIHCSDVHLGSALTSNFSKEIAEKRSNELTVTFARLADAAQNQGVKAVIIAGDLFDKKSIKKSLLDAVTKTIKDAPDTDFLYLKGNHDKDTAFPLEGDTPSNLKVFGAEWGYYDYDDVTIAGVMLTEENCNSVYDTLNLKAGRINIVVMHGGITKTTGKNVYNTVNVRKLANKNIDYLALGDYHSYSCDKLDMRGIYCYSGCLEGSSFDETGEKGYVNLDCQRGNITHNFVPFSKRTVYETEANISDAAGISEIEDAIMSSVADIDKDSIVRIKLTGEISPEIYKDITYFQQKLENKFYYAAIKDDSRIKIDVASYMDGISLKSEFIKMVLAETSLKEQEKEHIIAMGINALKGEKLGL